MNSVQDIRDFEQLKALSDPRRRQILQLLMDKPATISQLGAVMGQHPAWIRHHVKVLESAGLVRLVEVRHGRGALEKVYGASAPAFLLQRLVLPGQRSTSRVVLAGSHDIALQKFSELLLAEDKDFSFVTVPIGSVEGLTALSEGLTDVAGCHLFDPLTGEFNRPFVHYLFPDEDMALFTVAEREQGLILPPGNPRNITAVEDLARPDVHVANRNRSSATRVFLDWRLRQLGIVPSSIAGYAQELSTHSAVAEAVAQGKANVGMGIEAAARDSGLDFIPLFNERYDLVFRLDRCKEPDLQRLLDLLSGSEFRQLAASLGGYSLSLTGNFVPL
jgi:putative molybdopterin biosynthesis protein